MEGTFGSDDDNALLDRVAESMKVGGKQSKDRFIFVVNKMDDRRKEDGDTAQTLERVRNEYLVLEALPLETDSDSLSRDFSNMHEHVQVSVLYLRPLFFYRL